MAACDLGLGQQPPQPLLKLVAPPVKHLLQCMTKRLLCSYNVPWPAACNNLFAACVPTLTFPRWSACLGGGIIPRSFMTSGS
jgi:hypothetical protein